MPDKSIIVDDVTDAKDAEDTSMSALEDVVGRDDFDDLSDEEIIDLLKQYGLSEEEIEDLLTDIDNVKTADSMSDTATEAQRMADEDNTEVTVTEEDRDDDGDTDKITIEKESEETDGLPLDFVDGEEEDSPHDEKVANVTNDIAKTLSGYRW